MDSIISNIISSFETDKKKKHLIYADFISYVYITFDIKIDRCRSEKLKNKYRKMRTSILKYILENKKEISYKIYKHK
jgi:hypothetical protein